MKTLKKFEFRSPGNQSKYDWNKFFDGGIYQLEEGSDYTSSQSTFIYMIKNQAKRHGIEVNVQKVEGGVVLQALEPSTAETRAAGQAALKAARQAKKAETNGDSEEAEEAADE